MNRIHHRQCIAAVVVWVALTQAAAYGQTLVRKVAEPFQDMSWALDPYNKAGGSVALAEDVPADLKGKAARSMRLEATFSGKGFEWWSAHPQTPLVIPGELRKVSLWAKSDSPDYPLIVVFRDGWGREQAGGKKLEWAVPLKDARDWQQASFNVPKDWVGPVSIAGFTTHNWEKQQAVGAVHFSVVRLEAETDLASVDPQTGLLKTWKPDPNQKDAKKNQPPQSPLFGMQVQGEETSNVFAGRQPVFHVSLRSWLAGETKGALSWSIADHEGKPVARDEVAIAIDDVAAKDIAPTLAKLGLYGLRVEYRRSDGQVTKSEMPLAYLPAQRKLDEAQRMASPYGLNVHGGRAAVVTPYTKAGIVWFREYAFAMGMVRGARGADNQYNGWPFLHSLVRRYGEAGGKVVACLQKSITPLSMASAKAGVVPPPSQDWVREMAQIVLAFPEVTWWELDNEYDLNRQNLDAETVVQWRNYGNYHRKFAELLDVLGDGRLTAVEQGRAGIWPEREEALVRRGDFARIAVVNSHYYTGVEAPETSVANFNGGAEQLVQDPMLFIDQLRAAKAAGCADGKIRQHWLTEFGWDTKAGNVVTHYEQAVYLARAYMMTLAAGTDKAFWFFDIDAPESNVFFDGCGLLTHDLYPKLSLCSFAAMTWLLPSPKYVGTISAGEGTCGYVFEQEGKLVAALWSISAENGPTVTFDAEQLYDFLGNPLEGKTAALKRAPVYAVGLRQSDRLYSQTAYSLQSRHLIGAASGDSAQAIVQIRNNRTSAIRGEISPSLPAGWSAPQAAQAFDVPAGQTRECRIPFTIAATEPLGEKQVRLVIREQDAIKEIPVRVMVWPAAMLTAGTIQGAPGKTTVPLTVGNRSSRAMDAELRIVVPATWSTPAASVPAGGLKAGEVRKIDLALNWDEQWDAAQEAFVELLEGKSVLARRPLIPPRYVMHKAPAIKLDGDLSDWPASCQLPAWMLGSSQGAANARVFLAWSAQGLSVGVEVHDSKVRVTDPRAFWGGDCLEVLLDTRDEKHPRKFEAGDHQFWLVPLPDEKRVYLGRWKRNAEVPATQYDITPVQSMAKRTADGYIMECLIPAAQIQRYAPQAGSRLGVNLNLNVAGRQGDRAVYWPSPKDAATFDNPGVWGSLKLLD